MKAVRGVRGAISVERDDPGDITLATTRLVREMVDANAIDLADIASIIFSLTPDLVSAFPASAARALGLDHVPMLDVSQVDVSGALPRCVRVLLHANTDRPQYQIQHVYLERAAQLRPDLRKSNDRL